MATTGSHTGSTLIRHLTGQITSTIAAAFKMLNVATDGTQEATSFINTDSNVNQGVAKFTQLHIGASSSETQVDATGAEINQAADGSARGVVLITTKAVEATDNNKIFFLDLVGGFTVTMPALSEVFSGWQCKFLVKTAPTTAYIITEDDTDKVVTNSDTGVVLTATDSPASTGHTFYNFVASQAIVGDWCVWETNGVNWFVYGRSNVFAGLTVT